MKEHITELPSVCWCKPRVEVVNGSTITIHRCPDCGSTTCVCEAEALQAITPQE